MKTIWKFPLEVTDEQVLMVPKGAKPLTVQKQDGKPCLWCEVDSSHHKTSLTIYIGTYQMMGGALIWHVYGAFKISYS